MTGKSRADLTDAERAEVDRSAALAFRARDTLADLQWVLGHGIDGTLQSVIAWLQETDRENTDRIDAIFGLGKGQG